MPEYLAPGVFVEEVSFRAKSIEGVPTSTTGFSGLCRTGPVTRSGGPRQATPRLITSFTEFERVYGGLEPLQIGGVERPVYLAHGAKAFFDNGGRRLYISRVFVPNGDDGVARLEADPEFGESAFHITARWPGLAGNLSLRAEYVRVRKQPFQSPGGPVQIRGLREGDLIEVAPNLRGDPDPDTLRVVSVAVSGVQEFIGSDGAPADLDVAAAVYQLLLRIVVDPRGEEISADQRLPVRARYLAYSSLSTSSAPGQRRFIGRVLGADDPEDSDTPILITQTIDDADAGNPFLTALAFGALISAGSMRLRGGNDGAILTPDALHGEAADPDNEAVAATGLFALAEVEDISIVAAPDMGTLDNDDDIRGAAEALITHVEVDSRYRIALVDGPRDASLNGIREFRGRFDSTRAALYYPWIDTQVPGQAASQGAPPQLLPLPPSAFVAGIYARTDVARGVYKAPANELIRGVTRFRTNVTTPRQEVINPEGINALRFFEGRGYRVWGARTMTSDQEWKYVNVRRLFNFMEASIDRGTQFAVFEPNGPRLWDNVRRAISSFLLTLWKEGALLGNKPEDAYFVRCDRTTMTQNDLDNGRLICLIGVAPVKPAEFVIFRIGQWTADAEA